MNLLTPLSRINSKFLNGNISNFNQGYTDKRKLG